MSVSTRSRAIVLAHMAALVAGCESYRAAPFDPEAFGQAWRERGIHADTRPAPTSRSADGLTLTLRDAQSLALRYNPTLRVARLKAGVTKATADHAGRWADPTLSVDAERIVSGASDPWVVGGTVGLTLPISGRLEVERQRATADHAAQLIRLASDEWSLRQRLATLWTDRSLQLRRVEMLDALIARLDEINRVTERLAEAGQMTQVAARLFQVERASRAAEQLAARSRLRELTLELHAMIGLTPDAPLTFASDPLDRPIDAATPADLAERNFAIRIAAAEYDVAELALKREVRAQYPDLTISPGFGTDEGDEHALLGLSLPLPLWNRNQQGIAEARAQRDVSRAELEMAIEVETSAVAVERERLRSAIEVRQLYASTVVPRADEQASQAARLAELGEVDAVLLLDSFVRQYEARLALLDAELAVTKHADRLAELAGPSPDDATHQNQEGAR